MTKNRGYDSFSPKVDVLCLQEHKLRGDNVVRNMRMLWRRDNFWSLKASPSNEVEDIHYKKNGPLQLVHND
jgi:hypothetical protein